jgi:hypothetical protein
MKSRPMNEPMKYRQNAIEYPFWCSATRQRKQECHGLQFLSYLFDEVSLLDRIMRNLLTDSIKGGWSRYPRGATRSNKLVWHTAMFNPG